MAISAPGYRHSAGSHRNLHIKEQHMPNHPITGSELYPTYYIYQDLLQLRYRLIEYVFAVQYNPKLLSDKQINELILIKKESEDLTSLGTKLIDLL